MKKEYFNGNFMHLLKKNGLVEKTVKSKKLLGLTNVPGTCIKNRRILFSSDNIDFLYKGEILGSTNSLTEIQFRHVVLYLTMGGDEFRTVSPGKKFNLTFVGRYIENLKKEYKTLELYGTDFLRQNEILRILKVYNSVVSR
ncbi:MAG: hypothetical protein HRT71_17235 [Flavobacteriales bacterium]|nr:hypothetical protein [Flavobacteriales bacterium]